MRVGVLPAHLLVPLLALCSGNTKPSLPVSSSDSPRGSYACRPVAAQRLTLRKRFCAEWPSHLGNLAVLFISPKSQNPTMCYRPAGGQVFETRLGALKTSLLYLEYYITSTLKSSPPADVSHCFAQRRERERETSH